MGTDILQLISLIALPILPRLFGVLIIFVMINSVKALIETRRSQE